MTTIATQPDLPVLPSVSDVDAKVDEALLESFPAGDAPSWMLGVSPPRAANVVDVSRPPSRGRSH
jgi:hypothetical protein